MVKSTQTFLLMYRILDSFQQHDDGFILLTQMASGHTGGFSIESLPITYFTDSPLARAGILALLL